MCHGSCTAPSLDVQSGPGQRPRTATAATAPARAIAAETARATSVPRVRVGAEVTMATTMATPTDAPMYRAVLFAPEAAGTPTTRPPMGGRYHTPPTTAPPGKNPPPVATTKSAGG